MPKDVKATFNACDQTVLLAPGFGLSRTLKLASICEARLDGRAVVATVEESKEEIRIDCASLAEAENWLQRLRVPHRNLSVESFRSYYDADDDEGNERNSRCSFSVPTIDEDDDAMTIRSSSTVSLMPTPSKDLMSPQRFFDAQPNHTFHSKAPPPKQKVLPIATSDTSLTKPSSETTKPFVKKKPPILKPALDCSPSSECAKLCEYLFIANKAIACDPDKMREFRISHVLNMALECDNYFEPPGTETRVVLSEENERKNRVFEDAARDRRRRSSLDSKPTAPTTTTTTTTTTNNQNNAAAAKTTNNSQNNAATAKTSSATGDDSGKSCGENHCGDLNCICYLKCPCTDNGDDNVMRDHLHDCADFIHEARLARGKVLIHCNSGISRSSAAVLAYAVKYGIDGPSMSLIDALRWLRDHRRIASPHPDYMRQLCDFEVSVRGGRTTLNAKTYSNNRYEDVDNLHANLADPRSTANLLGDRARPQDMSPVYSPTAPARLFPDGTWPTRHTKAHTWDFMATTTAKQSTSPTN